MDQPPAPCVLRALCWRAVHQDVIRFASCDRPEAVTILPACSLCNAPITAAIDSNDHLIPNSIGGRKKVKGFLCTKCNSDSGNQWDADLAKQLNSLSLLFGIKRDRGDVPSQVVRTTGGDELLLHANGSMTPSKPEYREEVVGAGVQINIKARSVSEAKQMLTGVKKKYPQIDLDELLHTATTESSYPKDMLHFSLSFGGQKAGRSVVKSALALAVQSGVSPEDCKNALNYLTNEKAEACFGYYYERDLVRNRPDNIVFHCVAVEGSSETGLLLGYVEYYGVQRMVLCLSDSYTGKPFRSGYAIDPISGKELTLDIDLSLQIEDVAAAYRYEKIPDGAVEAAFAKVLPIGLKYSYEREKDRVLQEAVAYAFANCGASEGEILTAEHMSKISALIMQKLEPFLIHQFTESRGKRNV